MTPSARTVARVLTACGLAVLPLLAPASPATATDLESLRERAQRVADEVSALEHRLEELRARNAALDERIGLLSQRIAVLEGAINAQEADLAAAHAAFVERAVEAYKAGPTSELALLLSARDLPGLLDAAEGLRNAADDDLRALHHLVDAVESLERTQAELDGRKQSLLAAEGENELVTDEIAATLSSRRAALARLNEEVARLEARARRRAARAARPDAALAELLEPAGPAAAIPEGYVGTGITFEGIASWYGPGFEGNPTATGDVFNPDLYTAASRDLPFGTLLFVQHEGEGVVVVINDRGPYIEERILDLSQAAAEAIGLGLGWITAEIVVPERG